MHCYRHPAVLSRFPHRHSIFLLPLDDEPPWPPLQQTPTQQPQLVIVANACHATMGGNASKVTAQDK